MRYVSPPEHEITAITDWTPRLDDVQDALKQTDHAAR
jgi:hypothetical protein